jgi:hypothetical protein
MRKLQILKTFIDIFWYSSLLAGIFLLIFIPFAIFSDEVTDIPIKISGQEIVVDNIWSKIILVISHPLKNK